QVLGGLVAGSEPWYKATLLLDVFSNLFGLEDDKGIEVGKEQDGEEVGSGVERVVGEEFDRLVGCLADPFGVEGLEEPGHHWREDHDRKGKDNRDHASH